tara:strand:- start:52 stop:378 length:327 start_codon:yes stop_codon:yes gene_type:complete
MFIMLISCGGNKEIVGASWSGSSDFMFISDKNMKMNYSSFIEGNSAFIGGFYEIVKKETDSVINTIKVTDLEFEKRTDGVFYCRIWGEVQGSEDDGYLLADDCQPIFN